MLGTGHTRCRAPSKCLICLDRGEKDVAHVYGQGWRPAKLCYQENTTTLAQRSVALKIVSAYRTVSTNSVLVLESVSPIDLLAKDRQETSQLRKELTCISDLQETVRVKEPSTKMEGADLSRDGRRNGRVNIPVDGRTARSRSSPPE